MPTFHVVVTGHVDLTRRHTELPEKIHQVWVDDVDSPIILAQRVADRLKEIVDSGGMVARLNPFEGMEPHKHDKRVWVPLHMLTYIDTEIRRTTQEMPQPDPEHEGEFVDKQGNRVRKQ